MEVCPTTPILSQVTTVLLIRHARSVANSQGILAGRSDTPLDDAGRDQALDLGNRLASVPLDVLVSSPSGGPSRPHRWQPLAGPSQRSTKPSRSATTATGAGVH